MSGEQWKINGIMNGHGCLAVTEHKAGIEQVPGLDLDLGMDLYLGMGLGLGIDTLSHLFPHSLLPI